MQVVIGTLSLRLGTCSKQGGVGFSDQKETTVYSDSSVVTQHTLPLSHSDSLMLSIYYSHFKDGNTKTHFFGLFVLFLAMAHYYS